MDEHAVLRDRIVQIVLRGYQRAIERIISEHAIANARGRQIIVGADRLREMLIGQNAIQLAAREAGAFEQTLHLALAMEQR